MPGVQVFERKLARLAREVLLVDAVLDRLLIWLVHRDVRRI